LKSSSIDLLMYLWKLNLLFGAKWACNLFFVWLIYT
jgi:hypothetical protein